LGPKPKLYGEPYILTTRPVHYFGIHARMLTLSKDVVDNSNTTKLSNCI
jgi:hypothetical protein